MPRWRKLVVWTNDVDMKNDLLAVVVVVGVEARFRFGFSATVAWGRLDMLGFDGFCNERIELIFAGNESLELFVNLINICSLTLCVKTLQGVENSPLVTTSHSRLRLSDADALSPPQKWDVLASESFLYRESRITASFDVLEALIQTGLYCYGRDSRISSRQCEQPTACR